MTISNFTNLLDSIRNEFNPPEKPPVKKQHRMHINFKRIATGILSKHLIISKPEDEEHIASNRTIQTLLLETVRLLERELKNEFKDKHLISKYEQQIINLRKLIAR